MNKKFAFTLFFTLIFLVFSGTVVFASGSLPGSGWWTSQTVQNVGTSTANLSATAYNSAGASTYISTTSVISGWASTFGPSSFSGMPSGFSGSAVVSADQPIVAVGYVTNLLSGGNGVSGGKAAGRFQGMNSPATTLYFSVAKNNWFGSTTIYYIQNAGTIAATAQLTFTMGSGSVYTYTTPSIGANKMVVVSPADAGVPNGPSDNATQVNLGALTIRSSQPLAAIYVEYRVGETVGTAVSTTRAFTASDFGNKAYGPSIKNSWFQRFTGIGILNVDSVPISVTVNYVGTGGASCLGNSYTDTANNIQPGKSARIVQYPGFTTLPTNCVAAATINSTGNFLATVNEANTSDAAAAGSVVYAIPSSTQTNKLAAPIFMDQRFGFTSGFQVQNVGTIAATNVVATFKCYGNGNANTPFTAITNPMTIGPGSSFLFYRPSTYAPVHSQFTSGNPFNLSNSVCSVIVTGDQPLVGLMNEAPDTVGAADDAKSEAFNLP